MTKHEVVLGKVDEEPSQHDVQFTPMNEKMEEELGLGLFLPIGEWMDMGEPKLLKVTVEAL